MIQEIQRVLENYRRRMRYNTCNQETSNVPYGLSPQWMWSNRELWTLLSTATHWWQSRTTECSRSRSNETWYKGEGWFKKYIDCSKTTEEEWDIIHAIKTQAMCHTGYHPSGCGASVYFGLYKVPLHFDGNQEPKSAQEAEATRHNIREKDDSRNTKSALKLPKKNET